MHSARRDDCSCVSKEVWGAYDRVSPSVDKCSSAGHFLVADLTLNLPLMRSVDIATDEDSNIYVGTIANQSLHMCRADTNILDSSTRELFRASGSLTDRNRFLQADAYCLALHCTAATESLLSSCLGSRQGTTMLKDVLADVRLLDLLPVQFIELCRYLFLPTHLNFRNLIWHGFMSPSEIEWRYLALSIVMERTVRAVVTCSSRLPAGRIRDFSAFRRHFGPCLRLKDLMSLPDIDALVQGSLFAVYGKKDLFVSAFHDFKSERYVKAMLKAIPCIEHGLRFVFSLCNYKPEYMLAWADSYFSTLDGFGQRSKHQLLLDYDLCSYTSKCCSIDVIEGPRRNALLTNIDAGMYAKLVDLFFTDAGPNVRSAFAHGEYDTATSPLRLQIKQTSGLPEVAAAVMCLATGLLSYYRMDGALAVSLASKAMTTDPTAESPLDRRIEAGFIVRELISRQQSAAADVSFCRASTCFELQRGYCSVYHVNSVLAEEFKKLAIELGAAAAVVAERASPRLLQIRCLDPSHRQSGGECCSVRCSTEARVQIGAPVGASVEIWESTTRLSQICNALVEKGFNDSSSTAAQPSALKILICTAIDECSKFRYYFEVMPADACCRIVQEVVTATVSTAELLAHFDRLLDVIGLAPVPFGQRVFIAMFPACLQLARDLRCLCSAMHMAILEKEIMIISGESHSSDRRQYLTFVLCLGPAIVSLVELCFQVLVCHVYSCGELRCQAPSLAAIEPSCIKALCNLIPAVAACLPKEQSDATQARTQNDKKPVEKIVLQILKVLRSKNVQNIFSSLKMGETDRK